MTNKERAELHAKCLKSIDDLILLNGQYLAQLRVYRGGLEYRFEQDAKQRKALAKQRKALATQTKGETA
jgi:hypothetical protein